MSTVFLLVTINAFRISSAGAVSPVAGGFKDIPWDTDIKETISVEWSDSYSESSQLPLFLNGTLYRVTPAIWRYDSSNPHWFDGLSMVLSFKFDPNPANNSLSITYHTKFVNTSVYNQYDPNSDFVPKHESWNTDVTIRRINNDSLLTNTGEINSNSFSAYNLSTLSAPYQYNDSVWSDTTKTTNAPSHSQYDPDTKLLFHYFINHGEHGNYSFYYIKPNTNTRILLPNNLSPLNKLKIPLYQHSFGLTKNYIILCEQPQLLSDDGPGQWVPNMNSTWYVLDRSDGKLIKTFVSAAFGYFHFINSYETNDGIVVDLIDDGPNGRAVYDAMYLNTMIYNSSAFVKLSCLAHGVRFILDLNSDENDNFIQSSALSEYSGYEFPIINNKYNTKKYQYLYASANFDCDGGSQWLDTILKIDVSSNDKHGNYKLWHRDYNQYPGEPIFVANPFSNSTVEDDGVLLSLVFNGNDNSSYVLILNATDLSEIGTAAPHKMSHFPLGFHGRYYADL